MKLSDNREEFKKFVDNAYEYFNRRIPRFFIERDYYVTEKIKEKTELDSNIALKGGMAMAKAYEKIPLRISKDIDLTIIDQTKLLKGDLTSYSHLHEVVKYSPLDEKIKFAPNIDVSICKNPDSTDIIKVEIQSVIGMYLKENNLKESINKYKLDNFLVNVECPERIIVDKLCALCEAWEKIKNGRNPKARFSRHFADIYILSSDLGINVTNSQFNNLKNKLAEQLPNSFFIKSNYDFKENLLAIANSKNLKSDFENHLKITLLDQELKNSFELIKDNLINIANGPIFQDQTLKNKQGIK